VGKHARASTVWVELNLASAEAVVLQIRDDGMGFPADLRPPATQYGHLGLRQMRERVERRGGAFTVESASGTGTTIRVALPIAKG
jgi:signal transduction histidine kinase